MEGLNPMEYTLDSNNTATRNGSSVEVGRGGPGEEANGGASGGDDAEVASGSKESIAMVTVHTEPSQVVCEATVESRAEGGGGLLCETKMKEGVLLGNMDQAEGNDSKLNAASNGSNVEGGVVAVTHEGLDKSSAQLVTQAVAAELQLANGIEPSQGGGAAAAAGASRTTEHSDDSRTNKVYDLFAISVGYDMSARFDVQITCIALAHPYTRTHTHTHTPILRLTLVFLEGVITQALLRILMESGTTIMIALAR